MSRFVFLAELFLDRPRSRFSFSFDPCDFNVIDRSFVNKTAMDQLCRGVRPSANAANEIAKNASAERARFPKFDDLVVPRVAESIGRRKVSPLRKIVYTESR